MVCDAYLLVLQIYASSFGAGQWGGTALLFSVLHSLRRHSMHQGSKISQSLILIDDLSSVCWEKENERNSQGTFFPTNGHTLLAVL
jgi:hypothetical protein